MADRRRTRSRASTAGHRTESSEDIFSVDYHRERSEDSLVLDERISSNSRHTGGAGGEDLLTGPPYEGVESCEDGAAVVVDEEAAVARAGLDDADVH